MIKYLLMVLLSLSAYAGHGNNPHKLAPSYLVKVPYVSTAQTIKELQEHDLDVAGIDWENQKIDVLVNDNELAGLDKEGIRYELSESFTVMAAPDADYKNPAEIAALLKDYAKKFPALTHLIEIGKSLEGRSIWAIKISDNASVDESEESAVLFNGMHHAREVMTPEVNIDIIDRLLTGYGNDSKITSYVDNNEIWVLPMLNVDGSNKVWNGSNMWRKNTRGGYGVDLNRNYPYEWGACKGSSGFKYSQTYRGPKVASEPETQVMMKFVASIKPVFDISYHSYSELVIYPLSCKDQRVSNKEVVEGIGNEIGKILGYKAGTAWDILYAVDGGDIDWMYEQHQVIPYVIEVSSSSQGFQPKYATWRDKTVELNRKGWMFLLERLTGSGVKGMFKTQTQTLKSIKVFKGNTLYQSYKVNPDGSYHIVLPNNKFRLEYFDGNKMIRKEEVSFTGKRLDISITE